MSGRKRQEELYLGVLNAKFKAGRQTTVNLASRLCRRASPVLRNALNIFRVYSKEYNNKEKCIESMNREVSKALLLGTRVGFSACREIYMHV